MITLTDKLPERESVVLLVKRAKSIATGLLTPDEIHFILHQHEKNEKEMVAINHYNRWIFVQFVKKEKELYKRLENCRQAGTKLLHHINSNKIEQLTVYDVDNQPGETLALAEGMMLGNYQFLKYKKEAAKKKNSLKKLSLLSSKIIKRELEMVNIAITATYKCRDLVNEPVCHLNAVKLSKEFELMGREAGIKVEVMNKKKIEALKMGGLLAVNKGSIDPPTFTIMEWKPEKHVNNKPYILVGKGIVYDTGGLNIKTGTYMENMKSDMAGAAMMASALYAIAKAGLPVHVIALLPSTDNRPDGNAYASGDIIKMFDGSTVEVINTDAEGRMILADALSYAKKYDPALVINAATLTGAAARAIGKYGIVAMKVRSDQEYELLKQCGDDVYERLVEFPMWEEYGELIKSEVADIKNIGGIDAGAITAGKFLQHFTDYPFIHLDIAGPAFVDKKDGYHGTGGTGIGVRLLFEFIRQVTNKSLEH